MNDFWMGILVGFGGGFGVCCIGWFFKMVDVWALEAELLNERERARRLSEENYDMRCAARGAEAADRP